MAASISGTGLLPDRLSYLDSTSRASALRRRLTVSRVVNTISPPDLSLRQDEGDYDYSAERTERTLRDSLMREHRKYYREETEVFRR